MKTYNYRSFTHTHRPAYLICHSGKTATILANYSTLSSSSPPSGGSDLQHLTGGGAGGDSSMKTVLKYGDFGLGDVVCSVDPGEAGGGGGLKVGGIPTACTCHCGRKACCLSQAQATLLVGMLSVIFAVLIFAHEVALEGGFSLRNYVVLAFCVVWVIVTCLLFLGTCKKAHFLLLPWMILTCVLSPLFIVGIVAGCKVIASCVETTSAVSCSHEYHLFGTNDHTAASFKLAILLLMFLLNCVSFLVVYRHFIFLSGNESRKRQAEDEPIGCEQHSTSIRYERFDDRDAEMCEPLCHQLYDESKESIT